MSEIQELAPNIEAFPELIRTARAEKKLTNEELSQISGVPYSLVCKVQTGERHPKLADGIAIMRALDLSVDQEFDIRQPDTAPSAMQERIHELEVDNAVNCGDVARLTQVNDIYADQIDGLKAQNRSYKHWAILATSFAALLSLFLIAYLAFDFRIQDAGLIRHGNWTLAAWAVVLLIAAAIGSCGVVGYRTLRETARLTKRIE